LEFLAEIFSPLGIGVEHVLPSLNMWFSTILNQWWEIVLPTAFEKDRLVTDFLIAVQEFGGLIQ
jgi:hypothetical protein